MTCATKKRWETKADAKAAARRYRNHGWPRARVYRCPECGCWHLSTADAEARIFHRAQRRKAAQP